jgi:hypothetical protein
MIRTDRPQYQHRAREAVGVLPAPVVPYSGGCQSCFETPSVGLTVV